MQRWMCDEIFPMKDDLWSVELKFHFITRKVVLGQLVEELIPSFIRQKPNNTMLRQQNFFLNIYEPKISKNVSNEQLCQIVLKSMHKCRSNGPDKLNL